MTAARQHTRRQPQPYGPQRQTWRQATWTSWSRLFSLSAFWIPDGVVTVIASARFGVIEPAARMASVAAFAITIRRIASTRSSSSHNLQGNTGRLDGRRVHRLFIAPQPSSYRTWENN